MSYELVVTRPFANWKVGDKITVPADVDRILSNHHTKHVVKVFCEDRPAPSNEEPNVPEEASEADEKPLMLVDASGE